MVFQKHLPATVCFHQEVDQHGLVWQANAYGCKCMAAQPGRLPQELEHVNSIQLAVEEEVIDRLYVLLPRRGLLGNAPQSTGQGNKSLNMPTVACKVETSQHY